MFNVIVEYPLNNWTIKFEVDSSELFELIIKIFGLFSIKSNCDLQANIHVLVLKKGDRYELYENNVLVITSKKKDILGYICQAYYEKCTFDDSSLLVLHGGCLYNKDNRKVDIFLGPSHMGKSTFVTFLLDNGFDYFSDDIVPIKKDTLIAHCFPKAIYIRNVKIVESFLSPEAQVVNTGIEIGSGSEKKMVFSISHPIYISSANINNIYILNRNETFEKASLEKLLSNEALLVLINNLKKPGNVYESVSAIMQIIKSHNVYRLNYGNGSGSLFSALSLLKKQSQKVGNISEKSESR